MRRLERIDRMRADLAAVKPRSQRRVLLETRLRALVTRQMRAELRRDRKETT